MVYIQYYGIHSIKWHNIPELPDHAPPGQTSKNTVSSGSLERDRVRVVPLAAARRDQRRPAVRRDLGQDRIIAVRGLVLEVDARDEARQQPAGEESDQKMRRLRSVVGSGHRPRLDGLQGEAARVVRMDAAEPVERGVRPCGVRVVRMIAAARRVRLPDLDEGIGYRLGRRRRGPFRRSRWAGPVRRGSASDRRPCSGTRIAKNGTDGLKGGEWQHGAGAVSTGACRAFAPSFILRVRPGSPAGWRPARAGRCRNGSRAPVPAPLHVEVERGHQPRAAAARWGPRCTMGSRASSGSPGKYIWVMSRVRKQRPKTEKCTCAGRQALSWFPQGYAPGRIVVNRNRPSVSVSARPAPLKFGSSGASCVSSAWA